LGVPMAAGGGGAIQQRNPVMILLISMICAPYALIAIIGMFGDLEKAAPESQNKFAWWMLLIPIYGIILALTKLPAWVGDAKKKYNCPNPNPMGVVMYFFLSPFALATDLNEIGAKMGGG